MEEYRLIFSDIDGTLLNSKHEVPEQTAKLLRKIYQEEGKIFILVSARMPEGMRGIRDKIGVPAPMICYSGAYILDEKENCLFSQTMDKNKVEQIMELASDRLSFNLYSHDQWFAKDPCDSWVLQESEITGIVPMKLQRDSACLSQTHKILCMGSPDVIKQMEKEIRDKVAVSVYRSKPTYLEIMSEQVSKANAVHMVGQYFHIPREKMIAFGEGYNDLEMLQYVHTGIAMENAVSEIKKAADFVTLTNDEEGVRVYLERRG